MKKLLFSVCLFLPFLAFNQTCNKLNHNCSNTVGLNTSGVTSSVGSIYACGPGDNVLYSSSTNSYIATGDISIAEGMAATLHFQAKRSTGYSGTGEVWVHVGGYCNFSLLSFPFDDNGWVQIGTFSPNTLCNTFGPYTVPSDVIGGQNLSYCIVPDNASSTNWVAIDDICVSEISGSAVSTTMLEDFGTSSSGWYPNTGVADIPYHTYKNSSDAYVILGTGADGGSDKAAYFYTGFDFCSTVSGTGIVTKEVNTSAYTNGEIRLEFKSKYPCSGANSYTFDENYQNYSPEIYVMQGPDHGANTWTQLPVNYYFADYNWRVASYDISAFNNANVRFKIERGGFCGTAMEAVDNIKILDRDCSISQLNCGTISGDINPLQNTNYVYTVPPVVGANYYKWYVRDGGTLYDASPYIVSGQGTQSATINFNTLPTSGVRVLCIPFDADPSVDSDACYAQIGYLGVTVSNAVPLVFDSVDSVDVTCNGDNDGSITVNVSGGQPGYTYTWVPNVSSTNTASGLAPGPYQITVTDVNLDQIVVNVTINEPAILSVTVPADFSMCAGDTSQLVSSVSGGSPPYSYSWGPVTNISNASILSPDVYPTSNETYTLTVTDANLCTANDGVSITIDPGPVAAFTVTDECLGTPNCFTDLSTIPSSSITGWIWDYGDGSPIDIIQNPCHTYPTFGNYIVNLTVTSAEGCTDTISLPINVYALPTLDAGLDTTICDGDSLVLVATNPDLGALSWNNGVVDGVIFEPIIQGYYVVNSTSAFGCQSTDSLLVTLNSVPLVDLGTDITSCDAFVTLDAGGGMDNYTWSNTQSTQTIDATSSGMYWVVVDLNGCQNSDSIDVLLLDCTGIIELNGNQIRLFPNPTTDYITISGIVSGTSVELIDVVGKVIQQEIAGSDNLQLDVSAYKNGIYYISLRVGEDEKTLKFIKQ